MLPHAPVGRCPGPPSVIAGRGNREPGIQSCERAALDSGPAFARASRNDGWIGTPLPPHGILGEANTYTSPFTRRVNGRGLKLRKNAQTAGRPRLVPWGMCAALEPPCAEICCLEGLFSTPFRPSIKLAHGLLKPLRDPNRPSRRQELDTSASGHRCFSPPASFHWRSAPRTTGSKRSAAATLRNRRRYQTGVCAGWQWAKDRGKNWAWGYLFHSSSSGRLRSKRVPRTHSVIYPPSATHQH